MSGDYSKTDRDEQIVQASILSIGANLALVALKATVGAATNSIAVILDAVNNLGDALSGTVTIVGTRLAARRPDKRHPYGHGRIEYLTGMAVAAIVLLAGVAAMRESVLKTLNPPQTGYSALSLALLAIAVAVKLAVGRHVRAVGKRIASSALTAAGADAFFDAAISTGTLLAAVVSMIWGISLEGLLGIVISAVIIKAGFGMLMEPINGIIGSRPDDALAARVKELIRSDPRVRGVYDLSLHSYGPARTVGSAHIEIPEELRAREIHALTRDLEQQAYARLGVLLTIGIYAGATLSPQLEEIRRSVEELAARRPEVLQAHGFLGDDDAKTVMFDLVVDLSADAHRVREDFIRHLESQYPGWAFSVVLDTDAAG